MVSVEALNNILHELESDRVELTTSLNNHDKFGQVVCAFTNDLAQHRQSGFLIIGVDGQGKTCGLRVTDQDLQNLRALRSDGNIQPLPALTVQKFSLPEGDIAIVEVKPSDLPPVRYKGQTWVRIGPRKAIASEQEERILSERRVSYSLTFDASPVTTSRLNELNLHVFQAYRQDVIPPDVIALNHRSTEEQLASLRFYDLVQGCPTVAGLLVFGRTPRHYFPGAYVQYVLFPGPSPDHTPVDQAEISGDLFSVLRELVIRIRTSIRTSMHFTTTWQEQLLPSYPEAAVREFVFNAIMHRNYQSTTPVRFYVFSDHIEIQSSGGLYGDVTPQTMTTRNSYRNPVIAEAMKNLGFVNRFGYGIQLANTLLQENGNPPPEFDIDERVVKVVVKKRLMS